MEELGEHIVKEQRNPDLILLQLDVEEMRNIVLNLINPKSEGDKGD